MFFVAATMTLMSCEKEETTPEPAIQLAGTSWECEMNNVIYESGIQMNISLLSMIDFTDGTNAEWFMDLTLTVPAYPQANQSFNETANVTYKMVGNDLTLYYNETDHETGETESWEMHGVYNATDNTFTLDGSDEDMVEMMGTDKMVFHQVSK